jgi:hypothetical protein
MSTTQTTLTKKEAWKIVGGLSSPGKMPGYGWSISAKRCIRGSKMQKVRGSTCSNCYAMKGRYAFNNVQEAQERRFKQLDDPRWIDAMITLLKDEKYFRWFDSGDLQSVEHLEKIVDVVNATPDCKHWLPTREFKIIKSYLKIYSVFPDNLCVRLSSDFIDKYPQHVIDECNISTTSSKNDFPKIDDKQYIHNCPVSISKTISTCKAAECDACWNKSVNHINYKVH